MKSNLCFVAICFALLTTSTTMAQTIGAGTSHSVVLCAADSMVRAWGANYNGQLGLNDTTEQHAPTRVKGPGGVGYLSGIVAVVARENYSLALKSDGTVWAWGFNGDGESGNNTTADNWAPVQVHGPSNVGFLTGITAISGGYAHVLALRNDSTVWAWGDNTNGELGDNTTINDSTPVQVKGPGGTGVLNHIIAIAAGQQFSLALRSDSTVWAWGEDSSGQLGNNSTAMDMHTPVQVGSAATGYLTGVVKIAAGGGHALALTADGSVWSWGFNVNGELGNNTVYSDSVPARVHGPSDVGYLSGATSVKAGDYFSVALKADGSVWIWGYNGFGQLGQNNTTQSNTPVQVHGPMNAGYLMGITEISLGDEHAVAMKSDSTFWAWGWNGNGQLGNDSTTDSYVPTAVISPCAIITGVTSVREQDIALFPNPAYTTINISGDNVTGVELYDLLGTCVYRSANSSSRFTGIDISALPNGMYLARIATTTGIVNKKFVVEK